GSCLSPCHSPSLSWCSTRSLHDALPISTFDQTQALLGGQGAHGAVTLDAFLGDGRFTAADQGYPGAAAADHFDTFLQVVQEAGEIGRHTSELQSRENLVCRLLLEKKNTI